MNTVLFLQILVFSFTMWFGLYLVSRDLKKPGLRFAGLGLISYAAGIALAAIINFLPEPPATVESWMYLTVLLPSLFWMIATWYLLPGADSDTRISRTALIAVGIPALLLFFIVALQPQFIRWLIMLVPLLFLIVSLVKIRQAFRSDLPRQPIITLFATTIFFILGTTLLFAPLEWLSSEIALLAIGFDMILLGVMIGYLDAYEEGTRLLPDALRSLVGAALLSLILGGQVVLLIMLHGALTVNLLLLLFSLITTAMALQAFASNFQSLLDRLIFADSMPVQQEREALRSVNDALARSDRSLDLARMDEAAFARLTRQAISHYNDLNRLAASPLNWLPVIDARLRDQHTADNLLERTRLLKALLLESITRLKPYSDADFEPSDEWRYYNVLYFPYVVGLKPYSVRFQQDEIDPSTRAALEWMQTQVPERTLYNWQTAASRLIAQHLREINWQTVR